ncbi:winged-helix domain-containing protein [Halomontanus rarus]|uniref:winged-helix domain-containing protein n=1 Tax=Halomontanus rarus TaxID=3034020 RepID=UPI00307C6B8C
MSEIDDVILEYFFDTGRKHDFQTVLPPKTIWYNLTNVLEVIDRSPATVRRRMQKLDEMGLLEQLETTGTYYRITEKGVRYVEGDLTREELSEPSD